MRESEADVARLRAEALGDSGSHERAAILRDDSRMKRSLLPLLFNPSQSFSGISRHLHQHQVTRPDELLSHRVVEKSQQEIVVAIRIDQDARLRMNI